MVAHFSISFNDLFSVTRMDSISTEMADLDSLRRKVKINNFVEEHSPGVTYFILQRKKKKPYYPLPVLFANHLTTLYSWLQKHKPTFKHFYYSYGKTKCILDIDTNHASSCDHNCYYVSCGYFKSIKDGQCYSK